VIEQPVRQFVQVHDLAGGQSAFALAELHAIRHRLDEGLDRGEDAARRRVGFQRSEDSQSLPRHLVGDAVLVGQGVPGREDGRPRAGEAVQVVGPGIEVARVSDDDQEGARDVLAEGRADQRRGRAPGAIDDGPAAVLERRDDGLKPFGVVDEAGHVREGVESEGGHRGRWHASLLNPF